MTNNEENKTNTVVAGAENAAAAESLIKKVTKTVEVEVIDIPQIECEEDGVREFRRAINEMTIEKAESEDSKPTNPVRKNEVVVADECSGNLKEFKKAFYEGLYKTPSGLEKVGYRPDGFVSRDGSGNGQNCLAAKQFVVTIRRNGKWETLPRFLATDEGGHFALSASQTLKAARTLASHLNFVWLKNGDAKLLTKKSSKK